MSNDLMLQCWQALLMFIFLANYKSVRKDIKGLESAGSSLTLLVFSAR